MKARFSAMVVTCAIFVSSCTSAPIYSRKKEVKEDLNELVAQMVVQGCSGVAMGTIMNQKYSNHLRPATKEAIINIVKYGNRDDIQKQYGLIGAAIWTFDNDWMRTCVDLIGNSLNRHVERYQGPKEYVLSSFLKKVLRRKERVIRKIRRKQIEQSGEFEI